MLHKPNRHAACEFPTKERDCIPPQGKHAMYTPCTHLRLREALTVADTTTAGSTSLSMSSVSVSRWCTSVALYSRSVSIRKRKAVICGKESHDNTTPVYY